MTALDKLIEAVEAGTARAADFAPCFVNGMNSPYWDARRAFAGSLDAALKLHEALLPGWVVERLSIWPDQCHARLSPTEEDKGELWRNLSDPMVDGDAPTPARAWLLAILRAYRSVQA